MKRSFLAGLLVVSITLLFPLNVFAEPNRVHEVFTQPLVLIDAGHGGIDGGTKYKDILEKDINLHIGTKLYVLLRSKGVHAILNRTGDYALSDENRWLKNSSRHRKDLAQRRQLSEEVPTELLVSLHVNWNKVPSRRGPVVLFKNEGKSMMLAHFIQQSLNDLFGTSKTIEVGKPFYLLRRVNSPSVIIETGFISNSQDRKMLCDPQSQTQIARAISNAILNYLAVL